MRFHNQGFSDRILRTLFGLAMLYLGWSGEVAGFWGLSLKLFGVYPFATALVGWDPFYQLVGLSTCGSNRRADRNRH